jgi:signal transduction histidine kinase
VIKLRSFRGRLLTGSVLWGIGLILMAHLSSVLLFIGTSVFNGLLHMLLLFSTAVVLMLGGFILAASGLSSLTQLRERLSAVHDGRDRTVGGDYPTEVQPLVDDLNALLEHREAAIARAVARAGDLAHGLKTPLAVLAHEAARARADGREDLAAPIQEQIERMQRQIDYHLAQARASASGATAGQRAEVAISAEALARTLRRLYAARPLAIEVNVPAALSVRARREDLDEMLGNLLDNACQWARSRVHLHAAQRGSVVEMRVEDDGPGLEPALRDAVLQRGVRGDATAPGSGFGLAIVRDVAALYDGAIVLDGSDWGGVRAVLTLPVASHTTE